MKKLVILFIMIGFISCKKYNKIESDAEGDSYIRGRLFLYDTLTKNAMGMPLAGKTVKLFKDSSKDTVNYLLSAITDKDGYFVFNNLIEGSLYRIYYEEKVDSNIIDTAERLSVKAPFDTLSLNAFLNSDKEPGLHYTIRDATGTPVKAANICVYANSLFFTPGMCNNSSYSLTTDPYGHAFIFDIPSTTYYATAYITVNGINYLANDTFTVASNIEYRTLYLKQVKETGYIYHVLDESGNAIPGASLCFFTSNVLFNNGSCDGSNFQDTSNNQGLAKRTPVIANRYYVNANIKVDSVKYSGKDTIDIVKDAIINDTIILKRE